MRLGFHVSIAGGLERCIRRARVRRCKTLQMFTAAPVQWARGQISEEEGADFARRLAELDITPHWVHAKYLLNLASGDPKLRERSVRDLCEEVGAAATLGAAGVVVHLGSVGREGSIEAGIERVSAGVDAACEAVPDGPWVLLENSAGQGNMVGSRLEEIAAILGLVRHPERVRVVIDTAHAFAAGYAIHTADGLEETLRELDETIGLQRLALLHVNDSMTPFASGRDRHWHIGRGEIGREAMGRIVNHPELTHLPYIMETPGTEADDITNMRRIRRLIRTENRPPLPPPPDELR